MDSGRCRLWCGGSGVRGRRARCRCAFCQFCANDSDISVFYAASRIHRTDRRTDPERVFLAVPESCFPGVSAAIASVFRPPGRPAVRDGPEVVPGELPPKNRFLVEITDFIYIGVYIESKDIVTPTRI